MNILPTQYLTPLHPPTSPEDFIGPARQCAVHLERMIASSIAHDYAPLKLFYGGPSGTGKTALALYAQHLLKVSRWALYEFNGTDWTIDTVRDLETKLQLAHCDVYGTYRLIAIHEADRMSDAAQVKSLTLVDNLPRRTALICTTNKKVGDMEQRYQRRFKYTEVQCPSNDEIVGLLRRWAIPEATARMIAMGASGNVGMAMNEAEEWLQTSAPAARAA